MKTQKTYDAYIDNNLKLGLTSSNLESYIIMGYEVEVVATYKTSELDYNSIAIKQNEW